MSSGLSVKYVCVCDRGNALFAFFLGRRGGLMVLGKRTNRAPPKLCVNRMMELPTGSSSLVRTLCTAVMVCVIASPRPIPAITA